MSTTVVVPVTGENIDLRFSIFAIVTAKEDDVNDKMRRAIGRIPSSSIYVEDAPEFDEIELRAALHSELRAEGLNLESIVQARWASLRTS